MTKFVPYLADEIIEGDAALLLAEYAHARGIVIAPPIPIEDIVEKRLKLGIEFDGNIEHGVLFEKQDMAHFVRVGRLLDLGNEIPLTPCSPLRTTPTSPPSRASRDAGAR
jgi:hypothetical protein